MALSVLDEHIAQAPGGPAVSRYQRAKRRAQGLPNYRLVRYADDWCLVISGTKADAEALREEIAVVLSRMGLRLSPEKTVITHIDEGLDFLGWRIQRHRKRGTDRSYVYTYPARKALRAVMGKVKRWCRRMDTNQPLDVLLRRLNPMLRGWCAHFRPGVSSATFAYLSAYTWARSSDGCAANTAGSPGNNSAAATAGADGGRAPPNGCCSTRRRCPPRYRYRGAAIPAAWPIPG